MIGQLLNLVVDNSSMDELVSQLQEGINKYEETGDTSAMEVIAQMVITKIIKERIGNKEYNKEIEKAKAASNLLNLNKN